MTGARRFLVSCVYCHRLIMLERISEPELTLLREHVLHVVPTSCPGPSPGVEATLRHFRVEPEPGPPDAA